MERNIQAESHLSFPATGKFGTSTDCSGKLESITCDNASHLVSTQLAFLMLELEIRFSENPAVDPTTVETALRELRGSAGMNIRSPLPDISNLDPPVAAATFRGFGSE